MILILPLPYCGIITPILESVFMLILPYFTFKTIIALIILRVIIHIIVYIITFFICGIRTVYGVSIFSGIDFNFVYKKINFYFFVLRLSVVISIVIALFFMDVFQLCDCIFASFSSIIIKAGYLLEYILPQKLCCDSPSAEYVQYRITSAIQKGALALQRIFDSLEDGTFKEFVYNNCNYLHKPLQGDTPVLRTYITADGIKSHPDTFKLGPTITLSDSIAPTEAGVYVFTHIDAIDKVSQCGSATNLYTRLDNHYAELRKAIAKQEYIIRFYKEVLLENSGIDNFLYTPIFKTTNFVQVYSDLGYTLTKNESALLSTYTRQLILSVEQAYSFEAIPINYHIDVCFQHQNWIPGRDFGVINTSPVSWVTEDGKTGFASSISQATSILGVSRRTIIHNANCNIDQWVSSSKGIVKLVIEGYEWVDTPKDREPIMPPITEFVPQKLPFGCYAFDEAFNQVYGPITTQKELCSKLDIPYSVQIAAKCFNKKVLFYSSVLGINVYLAYNGLRVGIPTRVTDLTTNVSTVYESAYQAARAVNSNLKANTATGFINKYILLDKDYKTDTTTYRIEICDAELKERTYLKLLATAKRHYDKNRDVASSTDSTTD